MKNPQRLPTQDCPRLEVNLQALAHNWQTVNAAYRGRHVGAVVKYDAYGLGMAAVAQTLWQQGCRNFWVENMDEALLLRSQLRGNSVRIFVLGGLAGLGANAAGEYAAHGLIPVLTGAEELAALGGFARRHGQRLPIAVQLDTGLTRLGLQAQHLSLLQAGADLWQDAQPVAWISHLGHFEAPSDARNQVQKQLFDQWTAHLPAAERSLAASSCVFADAQWHYDHARVGSALYGVATTAGQPLEVVARLQAPILRIADVPAGVEVGYGDRFRTPRSMRIATVAIGYGDGLPFSGLQQCSLRLHGRAAPVVGGVAMGLLALDVSEFTAPELATGQWVEVYGEQQRIEALAMTAGLASNALLVPTARLSQRSYAGLSRAAVP